jgi:hypothetical protein
MRNWLDEIKMNVQSTRMNYGEKSIIIQVSEPLMDLLINLVMTTTIIKDDDVQGNMDLPQFFGCHTVVSKEISTYRIFVECIDGNDKSWQK